MKYTPIVILSMLAILSGCTPSSKTLYYWGDYSQTLYNYKKAPDEKTLAAHKKELENIIQEAPNKRKAVPPGVMAEYGYLLLREGKEEEGMQYLDKESALYPESQVFIQRVKAEYARGKK
jgi:hypothetical protein